MRNIWIHVPGISLHLHANCFPIILIRNKYQRIAVWLRNRKCFWYWKDLPWIGYVYWNMKRKCWFLRLGFIPKEMHAYLFCRRIIYQRENYFCFQKLKHNISRFFCWRFDEEGGKLSESLKIVKIEIKSLTLFSIKE